MDGQTTLAAAQQSLSQVYDKSAQNRPKFPVGDASVIARP